MKRMWWIFALFLFSSVLWANPTDARPANVEAWQEGTGSSAVVKLKWKYETGDKLYRTFNGDQWEEVSFTAPVAGKDLEASDSNGGKGFPKGSNVYYEIRDEGYSAALTAASNKRSATTVQDRIKRVNMFIDSGNPTAENAHGNYVSNTNACKSCHVTHNAKSSAKQLLTQDSVRALCETCHTAGGTGSKYLVDYGAVRDSEGNYNPSPAGPMTTGTEEETFGSPVPDTDEMKARGLSKATSAHAFTGKHISAGDRLNVDKNGTLLPERAMQCTSCHVAHPSDNNYRLLKSVNTLYTTTTDPATGKTTTTATNARIVMEAYAVSDGKTETVRYKSGATQFCEQCHKVFHNTNDVNSPTGGGSQTQATYDGKTIFLHPSDKAMNLHGQLLTSNLPLQNAKDLVEGDSPNNITLTNGKTRESYITCITCHYSHGTPKSGEQNSNFIDGLPASTMLKRMDNQGVCQECHKQ